MKLSYPHPIENIMRTTMEQIKEMVDVNTIVGDPMVSVDGTMILPVSKVSFGFVAGGGEYGKGENIMRRKEAVEFVDDIRHPFASSSAAGISLTPMAFVVVCDGNVSVVPAKYDCTVDRVIEMVPRLVDELKKALKKDPAEKKEEDIDKDPFEKE